ncbi:uncharacterized protein A1O9_10581 [Exophiala aquamarina CBS 119918]|uniref:Zn(2)-C6 fungal-type domain-containing protein n=1 Tax=Exophiala aquamarina CBS 119918 TaxID=1182545 RepID=A0A072P190_9EURO|nr:uncharacterized protein A1O9_10581 [Exophiala aquamarina CBS 119918]KEF53606.1 hypothetical protein A1O9_10581 [Exophiala aquamarina CBS 119918]
MGFRVSEAVRRGCVHKRAPKACQSCRTRKVRCDVTRTGETCTNCRLDNKLCVVPISKRRHVGDRVLGSSFVTSTHHPQSPICDAIIDFGDIQKSPQETRGSGAKTLATATPVNDTAFNIFDLGIGDFLASGGSNFVEQEQLNNLLVDESDMLERMTRSYPSPSQTLCSEQHPLPSLPSYIAALPDHIPADDVWYLQNRDCLTIPDAESRDRLLRAYATWVHPFTPMLDLVGIIKAVSGDMTCGPVSLLVFQSMMLAAAPFCDLDMGTKDRKKSRRILYERCNILHNFGIESDHLSILQSAILMSFWDGDDGQIRDSYYWIGIATLHANGMGLYLDPTIGPSDEHRQKVLKRTWWSLLIRDRLLAVALRRPVQTKAFRFDVPMLQIEDFELDTLLEAVGYNLPIDEFNLENLEIVASCCMAVAQLSEYIDKILSLQYSIQKTLGPQSHSNKTVSLVPKTTGIKWANISSCGQELQNWYGYLPEEVQQLEHAPEQSSGSEGNMANVHRALLASYYSMTMMTLYRPLLSLSVHKTEEKRIRNMAIKMVFQAAQSITGSFGGLYTNDLLLYLPETATAAIEPAIVTHLLYSTSDAARIRNHSFQGFYLCWNMLLQLGQIYFLADTTAMMINAAAQKLKAHSTIKRALPTQSTDLTELVDALCTPNALSFTSRIAVPFVGVVGEQRKDEIPVQWVHDPCTQIEVIRPAHELEFGMAVGDTRIGGSSDADFFEQLVCWDMGD